MKKIITILLIVILSSCLRIDDMAFLNDNSITEYLLDDYKGETELVLPSQYDIADDMLTFVSFESKLEGESEPKAIAGLYIGELDSIFTDTIILYCHGQTDHMDYYWARAKLLANCGGKNRYGVLMFDYRGYGLSEGSPSEDGMNADVSAALNWLKQHAAKNKQVIIYGFSLGSAPATYAAAFYDDFKPNKLILESPFSSAENLTQESTMINVQAEFLTDLKLENAEMIKDVDQAFMWFHGVEDDYIAISNGELIYNNYKGIYKEAHPVEGAKHGKDGVPQTLGFDEYLDIVNDFIER
ncbi:MAG: alpha/beta hydrolase [Bacteroidota bacterium]|nr:alpha/beta hydrolase [Bacteroidota bacterium]